VRILYLTNGFPYPLTSGRLRHFHFIRELSRNHAVTLVSIVGPDFRPEFAQPLALLTERVRTVASRSFQGAAVHKLRNRAEWLLAGSSQPLRALRSVIREELHRHSYDAIVCTLGTIGALAESSTPQVVLDLCDAPLLHLHGRIRHTGWRRRLPLWLAGRWYHSLQNAACRRADEILFSTMRDRAAVLGPTAGRGIVVPNGVDTEFWKRATATLGRNTVVFTGGMHYPPNADAALFLIREILPRVQRAHGGVRLLIVGHSPPRELLEAGRQAGVAVTGFVEDMRPYLEQATVCAAPLRFGAGIQNKLLEALAMEIPVVTSPLAADGLRIDGNDELPVSVAGSADEFAEQISSALSARNLNGEPHSMGRSYVTVHFSWAQSGALVERALTGTREAIPVG
jgi:glycosyltransferase involved in cell wall biosynthesis